MGMTVSTVSMVMKMAAVSLKFVVDFFCIYQYSDCIINVNLYGEYLNFP